MMGKPDEKMHPTRTFFGATRWHRGGLTDAGELKTRHKHAKNAGAVT
jgi:hypothetical protein